MQSGSDFLGINLKLLLRTLKLFRCIDPFKFIFGSFLEAQRTMHSPGEHLYSLFSKKKPKISK
jgi:hypothetical protein